MARFNERVKGCVRRRGGHLPHGELRRYLDSFLICSELTANSSGIHRPVLVMIEVVTRTDLGRALGSRRLIAEATQGSAA